MSKIAKISVTLLMMFNLLTLNIMAVTPGIFSPVKAEEKILPAENLSTNPRSDDDDDENPCPDPAPKPSLIRSTKQPPAERKAPTKAEYLTMVGDVNHYWGQKVDPGAKITLDKLLFGATNASFGADLSATLLGLNNGPGAIYLSTWSAKKNPTDALTANNLAVELKMVDDGDRALAILLYARSLEPDNNVVLDNLAFTYIKLNDAASAKASFEKALGTNKDDAEALAGLGFLAQCRGDNFEAVKYARESLKHKYLSLAGATVNSAEANINDDSAATADNAGGGSSSGGGGPAAGGDSSAGRNFTANEKPTSHPRGKDEGAGLDLTPPPVNSNLEQFLAAKPVVDKWIDDTMKNQVDAGNDMAKAATDMASESEGETDMETGTTIIYRKSYEKEDFMISDIKRIYDAKFKKVQDRFAKRYADLFPPPPSEGSTTSCVSGRPRARSLHTQFAAEFKADLQEMRGILSDMKKEAAPWIADIHDEKLAALENASLAVVVQTNEAAMAGSLHLWRTAILILYAPDDDRCKDSAAPIDRPVGALQVLKTFPEKCYAPTIYMTFKVVSLETTCDTIKFEVGGKVFGASAEYKFANDPKNDQITIFGGVKGKIPSKVIPGLEAGVKVGAEWVINAQSHKVVDFAVKGTVSAKYNFKAAGQEVGDLEGDVGGEIKGDIRLGLKDGFTVKNGAKFGFKGDTKSK